jgi:hypothetical protein
MVLLKKPGNDVLPWVFLSTMASKRLDRHLKGLEVRSLEYWILAPLE